MLKLFSMKKLSCKKGGFSCLGWHTGRFAKHTGYHHLKFGRPVWPPSLGPQKSLVRVCAHRGTETLLCAAMAAPSMIIEFLELIWEIKQSTLKSCTGSQIDSWIFQPRNTEPCNDDCVDPSPVFQKCISMRMLLFKKWGSQGLEPDAVPNSDNYKSADSCQGVNRQLFWSIVC